MPDEVNIHPAEPLITPQGDTVKIDTQMIPAVRALWDLGLTTLACCQDSGEYAGAVRDSKPDRTPTGHGGYVGYYRGWAWLKMPLIDSTLLTNALAQTSLCAAVTTRWQRGSWRMDAPFRYDNETGMGISLAVQIYLPRTQLTELTEVLPTITKKIERGRPRE